MSLLTDLERKLIDALIDVSAMLEVYTDPKLQVENSTSSQARSSIREARAIIKEAQDLSKETYNTLNNA